MKSDEQSAEKTRRYATRRSMRSRWQVFLFYIVVGLNVEFLLSWYFEQHFWPAIYIAVLGGLCLSFWAFCERSYSTLSVPQCVSVLHEAYQAWSYDSEYSRFVFIFFLNYFKLFI